MRVFADSPKSQDNTRISDTSVRKYAVQFNSPEGDSLTVTFDSARQFV